jgi:hypothetical protein
MPAMLAADMEAINKYLMTTPIRTEKAKAVQVQWIKFWKDTERTFTWYSTEEFDRARNIKREFDAANAVTTAQKQAVTNQAGSGLTAEELSGGVRRSTSDGTYIVDEEPFVPVRLQVVGWSALIVAGLGYAGVKYLKMSNPVTYLKKALK